MRDHLTVIPEDNVIIVDGLPLNFNFDAPDELHALQWREGSGHLEFKGGSRPNQELAGAEDYQVHAAPFVTLWEAEKARLDEEAARLEAEFNRPLTLEEARAAKLGEIIAGANAMSAAVKARYSQPEIASWQQQEAEARAILASANASTGAVDPDAPASLVRDLADNAGVSAKEFAQRIVNNADAATAAAKAVILRQQAMEKAVKAAQSVEAVQAISVNYIV